MRGYPQFSFWILIAADMIYLSHIVIIWEKYSPLVGTVLHMIVVGPTKSEKTQFVKQILTKNCIRYPNPRKPRQIYRFYNQWQDGYKTLPKQLGKEIKFIQGLLELKENMSDD